MKIKKTAKAFFLSTEDGRENEVFHPGLLTRYGNFIKWDMRIKLIKYGLCISYKRTDPYKLQLDNRGITA